MSNWLRAVHLIDWLRRQRLRLSALRSWTSYLGRPKLEIVGFDSRRIRRAKYSQEVDAQFADIRRRAAAAYPACFPQALHALDYFDNQLARMNVVVQCLAELPGEALGADIGVAYGYIALLLRDSYGFRMIGIDHPQAIPVFGQFAIASGLEMIPWAIGVDAASPIPDGSLDFIIFTEVLEHLNHSPGSALRSMVALLRPGGRLVLTTPNAARFDNVWRLSRGLNIVEPFPEDLPPGSTATEHVTHVREYTIPEVVELMLAAGLRIDDIVTCNSHRSSTLPLQAHLDETMCVVAHKPLPEREG